MLFNLNDNGIISNTINLNNLTVKVINNTIEILLKK